MRVIRGTGREGPTFFLQPDSPSPGLSDTRKAVKFSAEQAIRPVINTLNHSALLYESGDTLGKTVR